MSAFATTLAKCSSSTNRTKRKEPPIPIEKWIRLVCIILLLLLLFLFCSGFYNLYYVWERERNRRKSCVVYNDLLTCLFSIVFFFFFYFSFNSWFYFIQVNIFYSLENRNKIIFKYISIRDYFFSVFLLLFSQVVVCFLF